MIGIILYKVRFQKTDVKKYLCILVTLNLISTGVYLILTKFYLSPDFSQNFKIVFALNAIKIFLKQLLYLPVLAYWTQKDMVNVEGTMVSLLLTVVYLTITIAYLFGRSLMRILDVSKDSLENYWQLIACQTVYQLLCLPLIFFIPSKILKMN
jgi:hypothetical protein